MKLKNRRIAAECAAGLKYPGEKKKYKTFKDWILGTSGKGIYEHFMRPYNEKLYHCKLDKMLPFGQSAYVPEVKRKRKAYGYNIEFYYPAAGGIGSFSKTLSGFVFDRTLLNAEVKEIDPVKREITYGDGMKAAGFKEIISTLPLPELIPRIKGAPKKVLAAAKKLRYISLFALNLGIGREKVNKNHWLYFADPEICFYRTGFYSNVSKKLCPPGMSSLYTEVSLKQGTGYDQKKLVKNIKRDLIETGVLKTSDNIIAEQPLYIKYAYVIFDLNYHKNIAILREYLKKVKIISTGRYGAWNYSAMEEALLDGKAAAGLIK